MNMPLVLLNRRRRGFTAFSPSSLYSSGSQGIWLDPSDLTTMFSDRAGTTPVTTPGTVVGKRLDKSGRGNHAVAPTDAARPIYGVEPKGGRRNLLVQTENYTIANNATTDSAYSGALPVGTQAARQLRETATTAPHYVRIGSPTFASPYTGQLTFTIRVLAQGRTRVQVLPERVGLGEWAGSTFDLATNTATNTITSSGQTLTGSSVADSNDGWKVIRVTYTPTTSITGLLFCLLDDVASGSTTAPSYAGDASKGVALTGMQIETGSTATAYQRVTTDYDVTEAGVQTCHYCRYDGFNSSMSTSAIDFTGTDKMSVFAGVRKLSDANVGVFAELSSVFSNPGSFVLRAPKTAATANYDFISGGTTSGVATAPSTFAAPITNVLTGLGDIGGDLATLRINGTQEAQSTADQGTGTFGNYPLFIGRRNNASLPFNGRDYGLIIVGKAASAGEITDTELWLSDKTSEVDVAKSISPNIYTRSGDTILDRTNSIIERRTV